MILPVSRLSPDGADFVGHDPIEVFGEEVLGEVVHPCSDLRYEFHAACFEGELVVTGHAEADFDGQCCRCGGPFAATIGDDFTYSEALDPSTTEIDLTLELRDTILLALPTTPICSEACLGVCPHCGHRLADGPCACETAKKSDPWSALDSIFEDPSKSSHP